jgi:hypothetical protein
MDTTLSIFNQISFRIIKEQENIIGPLAWDEASKVEGLSIGNKNMDQIQVTGDPKVVINALVARYERLFGKLSRDVCKEAVADLTAEIPQAEVPGSLQ